MSDANITNIKNAYISKLIDMNCKDKADNIANQSLYKPVYTYETIHPNFVPTKQYMDFIPLDMSIDFISLDTSIMNAADKYTSLIDDVTQRLSIIDKKLNTEKKRLDDINMICSVYNYTDNVFNVTEENSTGSYSYDLSHAFSCYTDNNSQVNITATDVSGNGYVGNKYVLTSSSEFENKYIDKSSLANITDNNNITSFEYSRLISDIDYVADVNRDKVAAQCTVTFSAGNSLVNTVRLYSDFEDLTIKDILISTDNGRSFRSSFSSSLKLNDMSYDNYNYINGSNVFCFPSCNVFKIIFQSNNTYADEKLGYETITEYGNEITTSITTMDNAIRKFVSINQVKAYYNAYTESSIVSDVFDGEDIEYETIGIYANEYIPDYFENNTYISYVLNVNGEEYPVVPINSNKAGIKFISSSPYNYDDETVLSINETIKSATLKINIIPYETYSTPYVGNVKICVS